jgi:heptosyltransferase-1
LGYDSQRLEAAPNYGLKMPVAQLRKAQVAPKYIAFIHGTSRQDKTWPVQRWVDLGHRLAASGYQVALVHGSAQELATSRAIAAQLGSNCVVWPLLSLDALTQKLATCAGAIGVDSGVSHIAVALGLPHAQIYNFPTAWRTGPLGAAHQVSVFDNDSPTVNAVLASWSQCLTGTP